MAKVAMRPEGEKPKRKKTSRARWIMRIILGLVALLAVFILILGGSILFDKAFGDNADDFTNITYEDAEGRELLAYLAEPEGAGPHPAVIMVHEWWGINADITELADTLAEEGYVVLAPDSYRGRTTSKIQRALYMALTTDENEIWSDLDTGLDYLAALDNVDPERIASAGFCFGGKQSLELALRNADELASMVMFYGSPKTDPAELADFNPDMPMLGIWGEDDAQIPLREVNAMADVLTDMGVDNTQSVYDGMGHAFITGENIDDGGEPQAAWEEMVTFLEATLDGDDEGFRPNDLVHNRSISARGKLTAEVFASGQAFCFVAH